MLPASIRFKWGGDSEFHDAGAFLTGTSPVDRHHEKMKSRVGLLKGTSGPWERPRERLAPLPMRSPALAPDLCREHQALPSIVWRFIALLEHLAAAVWEIVGGAHHSTLRRQRLRLGTPLPLTPDEKAPL